MKDKPIESMGHFTAIGMRTKVEEPNALIINTCSDNDTEELGDKNRWSWSNPTNRRYLHRYHDVEAVSIECLWQACKMREGMVKPLEEVLAGNWRWGKGKKPIGAYAGPHQPLITTPGAARRAIYIPAFRSLIEGWIRDCPQVALWIQEARDHSGPVYLRDHDTGRGIDRNGPLSHAWVLASFLNTGSWDFAK